MPVTLAETAHGNTRRWSPRSSVDNGHEATAAKWNRRCRRVLERVFSEGENGRFVEAQTEQAVAYCKPWNCFRHFLRGSGVQHVARSPSLIRVSRPSAHSVEEKPTKRLSARRVRERAADIKGKADRQRSGALACGPTNWVVSERLVS